MLSTLVKTVLLLLVGMNQTLTCADEPERTSRTDQRPNVLLIMTDDQGYGDLSCHGNPVLRTPHLDELAAEGIELTQFYCCPNCSPTRAGLMTGRYNYRTGVTEVSRGRHLMYADELTIAELLRDAGYRTGIFGKWHLGDCPPMRPTDQGFDESLVHKGGGIGQSAGPPGNTYFDPILEHNNRPRRFKGYCDDIFTDAAIDFIERHQQRPFFCYLATNLPHFPLQVPEAEADPYRKLGLHELNARTYGMIARIDANVGRLLGRLRELNREENTIVVFLSDNGPRTRRTKNDRYPDRYNAGLRGTKTSVYENGIRVPFVVRWPAGLKGGRKISTIAAHIDVLPTLLDACGIALPQNRKIDGRSLLPLLLDDSDEWPARTLFFQWHNGSVPFQYVHFSARRGRYKLIQPQDNPHGIKTHPSDQELRQMLATLELFDIEVDSSEINNIASKHPDIVEELLEEYERWFHDVTSGRDFNSPQRIHIGMSQENCVTLTQFDWRGPRSESGLGFWEVFVARAATVKVTLRFRKTNVGSVAHLRSGPLHLEKTVQAGASSCVFNGITLPHGEGRFEAYLKSGRYSSGVQFVDLLWKDILAQR